MSQNHPLHVTVKELINQVQRVQQHIMETLRDHKERSHVRQSTLLHEMKNALAGILSCAEILENFALDQPTREDFVRLIGDEFERITTLAQEYRNDTSLNFEDRQPTCSMYTVLSDVVKLFEPECHRQHIRLTLDVQYTGAVALAADQMKQILLNVLQNARDAMPGGGVLTIHTSCSADQVCLVVSDTGCGMSPDLLVRFMDPFVTEGKPHGTGLGMAVVQAILKANHSWLEVNSQVQQGTTIRIWLPNA